MAEDQALGTREAAAGLAATLETRQLLFDQCCICSFLAELSELVGIRCRNALPGGILGTAMDRANCLELFLEGAFHIHPTMLGKARAASHHIWQLSDRNAAIFPDCNNDTCRTRACARSWEVRAPMVQHAL